MGIRLIVNNEDQEIEYNSNSDSFSIRNTKMLDHDYELVMYEEQLEKLKYLITEILELKNKKDY